MRRLIPTLSILAIAIATGAAFTRPAARAGSIGDSAATLDARRDLVRMRGEGARARERAAVLDRQARAALVAGDKATLAAAALAARVQQAEAAVAAADADLLLQTSERRSLAVRLAEENAPVAELLAGLQLQVRRPPLLQLLQRGSLTDAMRLRAVVAAINPQIRARTAALRAQLAQARALERDVGRIAAKRRTLQRELVARRGELAAKSAAARLVARRASSTADREAERAFAIGESARNLSMLIRRLNEANHYQPRAPKALSRTGADLGGGAARAADPLAPHRLPVQGRLVAAPSTSGKGLALPTRPGALIVSPGAGRVAFAGPYRGYGVVVILEHAEGWTSLLTGMATTQVRVGQPVVAGSPLGQAPARNSQITVELRRNGVPVDPTAYLH